jgi:hypothetical protein
VSLQRDLLAIHIHGCFSDEIKSFLQYSTVCSTPYVDGVLDKIAGELRAFGRLYKVDIEEGIAYLIVR